MKKYKVTVEIREKDHPYIGVPENVIIEVEAENEFDIPRLALQKLDLPESKIYWQMCWS